MKAIAQSIASMFGFGTQASAKPMWQICGFNSEAESDAYSAGYDDGIEGRPAKANFANEAEQRAYGHGHHDGQPL